MANRYWVGGTANWDGTAGTKWSATSGGAGGASVPTTSDAVFFTAASGSGTVTISSGNTGAAAINFSGFTGTLAGSANITVAGFISLSSTMTQNYTGKITFTGNASISTANKNFTSFAVDAPGATVTLLSNCFIPSTGTVSLFQGTLNVNDYSLSCGTFDSSTNTTRSINWGVNGSGIINLNTTATFLGNMMVLDVGDARNFTLVNSGVFYRTNSTNGTFQFGNIYPPSDPEINAPQIQFASPGPTASTITIPSGSYFNRINASSFQGNFAGSGNTVYLYSDALFYSGTDATALALYMRGAGAIDAIGGIRSLTVDSASSDVIVVNNLPITIGLFLSNGVFDANNYNITVGSVSASGTNTRTLALGNGIWTITNGDFDAASVAVGLTVTGTATIRMAATSQTFYGGSGITWTAVESISPNTSLTIYSSLCTYNSITTTQNNVTLRFRFGETNYVNNLSYNGSPPNFVTISSDVSGSQTTISKASGTVTVNYGQIKDVAVTGGATWIANNSVNNGNNTGWIFNNSNGLAALFF